MDKDLHPKFDRRQLFEKTLLASTALTIGMLGLADRAQATVNEPAYYSAWPDLKAAYFSGDDVDLNWPALSTVPQMDYSGDQQDTKRKLVTYLNAQLKMDRRSEGAFQHNYFNRLESHLPPIDMSTVLAMATPLLATHADVLLDQTATLLERAMRTRSQWDELATRSFMQAVDFQQFIAQDNIHLEETQHQSPDKKNNGYYQQDVNNVQREVDNELINNYVLTVGQKFYTDFVKKKWDDGVINEIITSYLDAMQKENKALAGDAAQVAHDLGIVFQQSLVNQYAANYLQKNTFSKSLDVSNRRLASLNAALDWAVANRHFQFRRSNVTRSSQYAKISSSMDEEGVLNYKNRIAPLSDYFIKDFTAALARIQAVVLGMDKIYGFGLPAPNTSGNVREVFDQYVAWTKLAVNYYNWFTRLDQTYTFSLFAKKQVHDEAQFDTMMKAGVLRLSIGEELFPAQQHVRLKGINIFVSFAEEHKDKAEVKAINGAMMTDITPPPTTFYRLAGECLDGIRINPGSFGRTKPVDRAAPYFALPVAKAGRIGSREFVRQPELAGATALYNASPFGDWTFTFPQIVSGKIDGKVIQEVTIDLLVTARRGAST